MSDILAKNYPFPYETFEEQSASPDTPASGKILIYAKSDKKIYKKDSTGTESEIGTGGAGGIEVFTSDPEELWDGRMWILIEPTYTEAVAVDLLSQVGSANYGGTSNVVALGYKASPSYKPTTAMYLTKAEFDLTSRSATYHNTGNDIRVRICTDDGTGKPNESSVLATAIITGCPATVDTPFTGIATFATSIDNFEEKILLNADTRYHFVLDIVSVTGNSFYSTKAVSASSTTDEFAFTKYESGWGAIDQAVNPSIKIYKAV